MEDGVKEILGFGNYFQHVKKKSSIFEIDLISRWPKLRFSILGFIANLVFF